MTTTAMELQAQDLQWMDHALALAKKAEALGEVPVGAVVVLDGVIIGEGWNQPISSCDPTAHAEVMALRDAALRQQNYRLPEATLYITLEPCTMCAGAIVQSRIKKVYIGCMNPKAGCAGSIINLLQVAQFNHQVEIEKGILEEECSNMLTTFFRQLREKKKRG